MDRQKLKEQELQALFREYKKTPELFERKGTVDDAKLLGGLGIFIPGKENFPEGYLKFLPQDFIVEEIGPDGTVYTVDFENVLSPDSPLNDDEERATIYATLVKCNIGTLEVVADLAGHLRCEEKQIQYAGIKDKNAITAQRISFRGIKIADLKKISSPYFFLKDAALGKGVVEKGGLRGNRFTILVRTAKPLTADRDYNDFIGNLEKIRAQGFYNFFYLQRFGTPRLVNFRWGYNILKGDCRAAVEDFLSSTNERESLFFQKLRGEIKKNLSDSSAVKKLMEPYPLIFWNEIKIAEYLEKNPKDFCGALAQLPEQATLWVYAFSSWLFNKKLSEYIKLGEEPPERLPLFLSFNRRDFEPYKTILEEAGVWPPPFQNLRPFNIQIKPREIPARDFAKIIKGQVLDAGAILQFDLGKGSYATTFLSHLFNLLGGAPPEDISGAEIDLKSEISEAPLAPLLERFRELLSAKSENIFEAMMEEK